MAAVLSAAAATLASLQTMREGMAATFAEEPGRVVRARMMMGARFGERVPYWCTRRRTSGLRSLHTEGTVAFVAGSR